MDFSRLLSFHGRIRRSEWWLAQLFAWTALVVTAVALGSLSEHMGGDDDWIALPIVSMVFFVSLISVTAAVKRAHDLDLSGWMALIYFVPVIGWLVALVVFGILPGTPGRNRFGLPSEELDRNPLMGILND